VTTLHHGFFPAKPLFVAEGAFMKGSVSNRRARLVTLTVSMSVVWLVFILEGFPWGGLLSVSLALAAAFWLIKGSTRSIANVIDDIEGEPAQVIARPVESARR
jgi:hypothetical protein